MGRGFSITIADIRVYIFLTPVLQISFKIRATHLSSHHLSDIAALDCGYYSQAECDAMKAEVPIKITFLYLMRVGYRTYCIF